MMKKTFGFWLLLAFCIASCGGGSDEPGVEKDPTAENGGNTENEEQQKPPAIDKVIEGETIADVLDYVQFDHKRMVRAIEVWVSQSVKKGIITLEEGREFISNYRAGLYGYTYLEKRI